MNKLAKWLSVFAVVALAVTLYIVFSAQMTASLLSVSVQNASERLDTFTSLSAAIERGDLGNNQYRQTMSGDAGDYVFITYTVRLSGHCPISGEWAALGLSPGDEDVAFVPGDPQSTGPFGDCTINAVLLTAASQAGDTARNMWVEYYVFGREMTSVVDAV